MLSYLSGEDVARTANRIFGIGGWDTRVTQFPTLATPGIYQATVRVSVDMEDGLSVSYEDTGVGTYNAEKPTQQEIEKAIKESVTDAMKRAFVSLGDQFGLCLYDKNHIIHRLAGPSGAPATLPQSAGAPTPVVVNPADLPPPNDGDGYKCDDCGKAITKSASRSAAENASFGYKQSGKIRCFSCRKGSS